MAPSPVIHAGLKGMPDYTQIGTGQNITLTGPPNVIRTGGSEVVLTSGSDLDRAAEGGTWPAILDGAIKFFNSFRPNGMRPITTVKVDSNYGQITSRANYGFRGREFAGVGNMPGPVPYAGRPTYDNLAPNIAYGLRVANPNDVKGAPQYQVIQVGPTAYVPPGTASLKETLL